MVGSVPYGLVRWVGMSLILGGGPTPRPPKLCISVYFRQYTQFTYSLNSLKSTNLRSFGGWTITRPGNFLLKSLSGKTP